MKHNSLEKGAVLDKKEQIFNSVIQSAEMGAERPMNKQNKKSIGFMSLFAYDKSKVYKMKYTYQIKYGLAVILMFLVIISSWIIWLGITRQNNGTRNSENISENAKTKDEARNSSALLYPKVKEVNTQFVRQLARERFVNQNDFDYYLINQVVEERSNTNAKGDVQDSLQDNNQPSLNIGSVQICLTGINQNQEVIDLSSYDISASISGVAGYKQSLPQSNFMAPISYNEKVLGSSDLNAICLPKLEGLVLGDYSYDQLKLSGLQIDLVNSIRYNDQFSLIAKSFNDFYEYDDSLFNLEKNPDIRNKDADGEIVLTQSKPDRRINILLELDIPTPSHSPSLEPSPILTPTPNELKESPSPTPITPLDPTSSPSPETPEPTPTAESLIPDNNQEVESEKENNDQPNDSEASTSDKNDDNDSNTENEAEERTKEKKNSDKGIQDEEIIEDEEESEYNYDRSCECYSISDNEQDEIESEYDDKVLIEDYYIEVLDKELLGQTPYDRTGVSLLKHPKVDLESSKIKYSIKTSNAGQKITMVGEYDDRTEPISLLLYDDLRVVNYVGGEYAIKRNLDTTLELSNRPKLLDSIFNCPENQLINKLLNPKNSQVIEITEVIPLAENSELSEFIVISEKVINEDLDPSKEYRKGDYRISYTLRADNFELVKKTYSLDGVAFLEHEYEFNGLVNLSYSDSEKYFNLDELVDAGIPILDEVDSREELFAETTIEELGKKYPIIYSEYLNEFTNVYDEQLNREKFEQNSMYANKRYDPLYDESKDTFFDGLLGSYRQIDKDGYGIYVQISSMKPEELVDDVVNNLFVEYVDKKVIINGKEIAGTALVYLKGDCLNYLDQPYNPSNICGPSDYILIFEYEGFWYQVNVGYARSIDIIPNTFLVK